MDYWDESVRQHNHADQTGRASSAAAEAERLRMAPILAAQAAAEYDMMRSYADRFLAAMSRAGNPGQTVLLGPEAVLRLRQIADRKFKRSNNYPATADQLGKRTAQKLGRPGWVTDARLGNDGGVAKFGVEQTGDFGDATTMTVSSGGMYYWLPAYEFAAILSTRVPRLTNLREGENARIFAENLVTLLRINGVPLAR